MSEPRFYRANSGDPWSPVLLDSYRGIKPGDHVVYENPALPPPPGPLVVTELYLFKNALAEPDSVQAILNDGEYELNADNLRKIEEPS